MVCAMKKLNPQQQSAFRFRRFCRGAWAAYSSMHREVTIGRVASYIADRQLRKAAAPVAVAAALAAGVPAMAQTADEPQERELPAVEIILAVDSLRVSAEPAVVLTASDFQNTSVRTVGELLALLPGLDLRTRGVDDVQADLAMRGGTFDQMVVLLGGVNLTDPQTGHHALDLPIDLAMVERVELLTPAQLLARGVVGFCGGINIVVGEREGVRAELSGGSHGTAAAKLVATERRGPWSLTTAGAYHRSDGYRHNTDYRHGSLLLQATRHGNRDDVQLSLGGQLKGFGSEAFYSIDYPDQYEATRTLTAAAAHVHRFGGWSQHSAAYGRLHADRFELFREGRVEPPAWYGGHNRHLSDLAGVRTMARWRGLSLGAELRHEGIVSNVLGDSVQGRRWPSDDYPVAASRLDASVFAGYSGEWRRLMWQLSALGLYNSQFGLHRAWAVNMSYPVSRFRLRLSLSEAYRMPTFTDLYYVGPNQVADRDLSPERSLSAEAGVSGSFGWARLDLALYRRHGRQIIDWMRRPDEEVWYSMNHAVVDATGLDFSATARWQWLEGQAAYSFCHIDQDPGDWISGSALDYLRHKARLALAARVTRRLTLKADAAYRFREGQYVDADKVSRPYGDVLLVNASAEYSLDLGRCPVTLYVSGYNLTDRDYRDHGGIPQPGVTFMAGVRLGG